MLRMNTIFAHILNDLPNTFQHPCQQNGNPFPTMAFRFVCSICIWECFLNWQKFIIWHSDCHFIRNKNDEWQQQFTGVNSEHNLSSSPAKMHPLKWHIFSAVVHITHRFILNLFIHQLNGSHLGMRFILHKLVHRKKVSLGALVDWLIVMVWLNFIWWTFAKIASTFK